MCHSRGGTALTYKSDGSAPTDAPYGAVNDNFLAKGGSLDDQSKKGESLGVKLHKIRAI